LAGFGHGLEKENPILIRVENGLAAVATIDDVIDRSWILDAQFSGHEREGAPGLPRGQQIM
jgi:hypothetical protein